MATAPVQVAMTIVLDLAGLMHAYVCRRRAAWPSVRQLRPLISLRCCGSSIACSCRSSAFTARAALTVAFIPVPSWFHSARRIGAECRGYSLSIRVC